MSFTSIVLGCSARDTIDRLAVYIAYYPTLAAIFCDPGKYYVTKETRQFCKLNGIYLAYVLSGASRLVGIVEKANNILQKTIIKSVAILIEADLRGFVESYLNQDLDLDKRIKDVNSRYIQHLGYLLVEIAFGYKPSDMQPTEQVLLTPSKQDLLDWFTVPDFDIPYDSEIALLVYTFIARRQGVLEDVQERDDTRRDRQKTRYDAGISSQTFYLGQAVMLEDTSNKGKREKLVPTFRGPFVVTSYRGNYQRSYTLRQINSKKIRRHFYSNYLYLFQPRHSYLILLIEATVPEYQLLRRKRKPGARKDAIAQPGQSGNVVLFRRHTIQRTVRPYVHPTIQEFSISFDTSERSRM